MKHWAKQHPYLQPLPTCACAWAKGIARCADAQAIVIAKAIESVTESGLWSAGPCPFPNRRLAVGHHPGPCRYCAVPHARHALSPDLASCAKT